jgi:hypothetical protein
MDRPWLSRSSGSSSCPDRRHERDPSRQPAADDDDQNWWVCRTCRNPIARRGVRFQAGSGPQVFSNPHGVVFEIITVREAQGLVGVGPASTEFSWFSQHAWRIVCCSRCLAHLGWHYTLVGRGSPPSFYGLIVTELAEQKPSTSPD